MLFRSRFETIRLDDARGQRAHGEAQRRQAIQEKDAALPEPSRYLELAEQIELHIDDAGILTMFFNGYVCRYEKGIAKLARDPNSTTIILQANQARLLSLLTQSNADPRRWSQWQNEAETADRKGNAFSATRSSRSSSFML